MININMRAIEILNETSLSRVWQHFENPETKVAILTAFRGRHDYNPDLTQDEIYVKNVERNKKLAGELRGLGYGFFFVDGHWIENQGTEHEISVKEDSIFVIGSSKDQKFIENIHKLGNNYNQDAVLVKDNLGARLIFKDGSEKPLGGIKPGKLGDAYTKLRTNKSSNTFVFEAERTELGFIARLAGVQSLRELGYRGI